MTLGVRTPARAGSTRPRAARTQRPARISTRVSRRADCATAASACRATPRRRAPIRAARFRRAARASLLRLARARDLVREALQLAAVDDARIDEAGQHFFHRAAAE